MSEAKGAKDEKFLDKAGRQACWKARDDFWACLKKNQDDTTKCQSERSPYEEHCPPTWVIHFDRKYNYNKFKSEAAKAGYQKIDEEYLKKSQQEQAQ